MLFSVFMDLVDMRESENLFKRCTCLFESCVLFKNLLFAGKLARQELHILAMV